MRCSACGTENQDRMKFCGHCAALLALSPQVEILASGRGQIPQQGVAQVVPTSLYAERRHLTVMFCDLVESTQLTELLDPEELHLVVSAYQNMCFQVVSRFEGYTAQYLGDGLLMYFGYPQAHEDDAARAVRAGLEIVTELQKLNLRLQDEVVVLRRRPLQIRIGIHTGLVVVSEMGKGERRELMALGEAPNVANRLQTIAEPNSVVLGAVTQRLTEGLFSFLPLGLHSLRGVSTPIPVYQVLHEQDIRNRFEIAVSRGLTPLIGRERSLELLLQAWEKAQAGATQAVLLKGEAGIGKSRLVQSLKDRLTCTAYHRLEYHCSPYHQHSALYPIIDLLQRLLGLNREDTIEQKLQKLDKVLHDAESGFSFPSGDLTEVRLLLAALLSIPMPENSSVLRLSPQRQKQKTLELLSDWVIARAATQPGLVIVEDLHWADPSTLELLSLVFDRQPAARILIVLTFRPDFIPPWGQNNFFSPISLKRLSREQVGTMISALVGEKSLPSEVVNQIILRTDGIPLFVEELTKTVLESGFLRESAKGYELIGALPSVTIPATLQDSLMARLDRLGAVKELAQFAAVVGREFSSELLRALVADDSLLSQGLQQLTDAELIYQRGVPPSARYFFKHALVQDAAYQSLLKSKRKQLHTQIAQVLEARFPETVDTHPELLAHHYTQAECVQLAIHYWQKAGMRASARAAHAEALQHLTAALDLMPQLSEGTDRDRLELAVQVQLGLSLAAKKGYAAPEVEQTYTRARDLCARLGESADLFPVVRGLCTFYIVRDEQKTARELAEQCLRLARVTENETYLMEGYTALGYVACYQGELETAKAALQEGVSLYSRCSSGQLSFLTPQDPGVACLSLLALVWWLQGETEQALHNIHDARVLAQQLKQPFNETYVCAYEAMLYQLLRQPIEAAKSAHTTIDISEKYGFDVWRDAGVLHLGIAKGGLGEQDEGITLIRRTLAAWRAGGAELLRPYFLAGLVEACLAAGQHEEAMRAVSEALAHVKRYGEQFYESTLYRLRGEVRLAKTAEAWREAEADFQSAITIACAQKAKALELRATVSLSRCLRARGRPDEARQLLQSISGQFPREDNALDLLEARELLAELG